MLALKSVLSISMLLLPTSAPLWSQSGENLASFAPKITPLPSAVVASWRVYPCPLMYTKVVPSLLLESASVLIASAMLLEVALVAWILVVSASTVVCTSAPALDATPSMAFAKSTALPTASIAKRRTAGYARVSTDKDEQFTSYEAQVDYYTKYIQSREDWEFVTVYTDEGISALNTKHRDGFKQMVKDALDGKIDLIVTKSVSRFARNTVDSLVTIRKLKEKGVECYFEKKHFRTPKYPK